MGRNTYRADDSPDEGLSVCAWDEKRDCGSLCEREACKCESKGRERGKRHIERCCGLTTTKRQYCIERTTKTRDSKPKKKRSRVVEIERRLFCLLALVILPDP
jgi:hypothetical protein